MKRTLITTLALLFLATGCVAQVGQPEEKTGTAKSSLGNGDNPTDDPPPDPGGDQATDDKVSDPGNNSTSGDNQGPQPLPWSTTNATSPNGSEQKK